MRLCCVILLASLSLLLHEREVECGYVPDYGGGFLISTEEAHRYPSGNEVTGNRSYFISGLNFDIWDGSVVTGAANRLVILNVTDLSPLHVYDWPAMEEHLDVCFNPNDSPRGSVSTLEDPEFICNNHIRVYHRLPSNPSQVLVCGTQAVTRPQCRILEVSSVGGGISMEEFEPVNASDGLVTYFPQFSQFGQFRATDEFDNVFLTAGFFPVGNTAVARHFSISYKNITMTTPSDPDTLQTTELYRTINANNNWLRFPVTFVGSHRADYSSPTGREADYQFWFLLLRENLVTDDIIYSRLVRVCRNDPGSTQTSDGARYFSTFMKARIFCERDKPSSLEFTGTLDYVYNSITSFVFSEEGRYYGSSDVAPKRLLYGSFTGPSNGPVGSALCVYPADNSVETSQGSGRTKSVFDIFREDITSDVTTPAVENTFLECAPEGRPDDQQQLLFINPDVSVEQIGDDPILVLDDVIVTQMVQDTVCVVSRDDSSTCINQDVLFLGLDSGRVLKVVFGTEENGDIEPIIAEDIELDPSDVRSVMAMELRKINNEKFLFVTTDTRVYKLPLQRCARFSHCNCSACVASRDPYCVYNSETNTCDSNTLVEGEQVDDRYLQDIHSGTVRRSCDCPVVSFTPSSVTVNESMSSVRFELESSREVTVQVEAIPGTADMTDFFKLEKSANVSTRAAFTVEITDDVAFEGVEEFYVTLSASVDVVFNTSRATIVIIDNDGSDGEEFAVLFNANVACKDLLEIYDNFTSELTEGLASGVRSKCDVCGDFTSDHIIKSKLFLNCTDNWILTFQGEMLATESADVSTHLLPALKDWTSSTNNDITITRIKLTAMCSTCTPSPPTSTPSPPTTSGLSSDSDNMYSAGEFAAVLVLFIIALVVAVVLGVILIVLLCSRQKFLLLTWKVGLSGEKSSDKSVTATTVAPSAPPPNDSSPPIKPHLVHQPISYQQAQNNPYSSDSLRPLVGKRTVSDENMLETVVEEFSGFAGPDDVGKTEYRREEIEVAQNTAYGSVKGDGAESEGERKGGRENGATRTGGTAEDSV